jgi:hypothetical protein
VTGALIDAIMRRLAAFSNIRSASMSGLQSYRLVGPLRADIVAKRFCAFERARLIQGLGANAQR